METFEQGATYSTRSICDFNCIFSITVAHRTAKTIVTTEGKRLRINIYNNAEHVSPKGKYSMSPTISADKSKFKSDAEMKLFKLDVARHAFEKLGIRIDQPTAKEGKKMNYRMTCDNDCTRAGWIEALITNGGGYNLHISHPQDAILSDKFVAFCHDEQEMISINGWEIDSYEAI